jgi:hypothetical protein
MLDNKGLKNAGIQVHHVPVHLQLPNIAASNVNNELHTMRHQAVEA